MQVKTATPRREKFYRGKSLKVFVNEVLGIFDCERDEMAGSGTKALILGASSLCSLPNIIMFIKSIWHGSGM